MSPPIKMNAFLIYTGLLVALAIPATQAIAQTPPIQQKTGLELPSNASAKKADEFLAKLSPPTSVKTLGVGHDLLLEFPPIAAAGPIPFKVVSTIPRTDGLWLLSLSPQPESGASLFTAITLEPSALPEATLLLSLSKTQSVLLVARASGKYYGLFREIKIGQPASTPTSK